MQNNTQQYKTITVNNVRTYLGPFTTVTIKYKGGTTAATTPHNTPVKNAGVKPPKKTIQVTRQPQAHHNNMYGANYGNKVFSMVKSSAANIKANKLLLLTATVSNVNYNYFNSCKVPSIANNSKAKARRYIAKIIANNVKYATYG